MDGDTVEAIRETCRKLRRAQEGLCRSVSQADIVSAVAEWAGRWQEPSSPWRREAEALTDPFPFTMTRFSLDALLQSLTPDALWALIDAEDVRDRDGYPLGGHVIAANTPLLAWVSLLRALLVRSASFVKLPSGGAGDWARLFHCTLAEVTPALAAAIHLEHWPGGTTALDRALCESADVIMAHGSDRTVGALRVLCPPSVGFIGYGHRVSFGLCSAADATDEAARGFARDVLLYDQGGCLSPHVVYAQGGWPDAVACGARLAAALTATVSEFPQIARTASAAMRVREARLLAHMEPTTQVWEDEALRWTVIARPDAPFRASPTHGVVSVQPLLNEDTLPLALAPVAGHLQGCAVSSTLAGATATLEALGVSRICPPGELQRPPFSWRQDGRDVLRSLVSAP